jgi:hypothetical protein
MAITTETEIGGPNQWLIDDEVIQLRIWKTKIIHPLPPKDSEGTIGAVAGCWLQLQDPTARVSRRHAKLAYEDGRWTLSDLHSKNGITHDGARRPSFPLTPGVEVGIGGVTLIGESRLLVALREILARLIGWAHGRRAEVDLALRSVRLAATRRESLLLCGDGDLVSIARLLHRHALGDTRPFVVCDPRRVRADPNARAAANFESGMLALAAAAGGTLCVWQGRQPDDFDKVVAARRDPTSRVQLVVCTHTLQHRDPLIASPIVLPPLAKRATELNRIIDAYAADAVAELGGSFTPSDRVSVRRHEATTLAQIEKATRRLVAIRGADGSITRAALQLGMSHGALSEWLTRRTLPALGHDDNEP